MAVGRTIDLFTAYRKGKGLAELHVFQTGAHGFVKKGAAPTTSWTASRSGSGPTMLLSKPADRPREPASETDQSESPQKTCPR